MRRFVGAVLCPCLLILTAACGRPAPAASASPAGAPAASTQSAVSAQPPATPSQPPAAPDAGVSSDANPAPGAPDDAGIVWYPAGIGHPLTSDDPRAKGKKVVMLTFDDGPSDEATAQVLDILKAEKIRALFFVTGYGAAREDLVRRIDREGHLIGTHTMTHPDLTTLDREGQRKEIVPVNEIVKRLTGKQPKYFRPPHGAYDDTLLELMRELKMELINWSAGSLDWEYTDPDRIVRQVLETVHPGAILLFHDTQEHTVQALPRVIQGLRDDGYEFVVLR